jgi:hypothetical protein
MQLRSNTQFTGKTATFNGTAFDLGVNRTASKVRWSIKAASVTTGATIKIQTSPDNTNWYDASTQTVNATGNTTAVIDAVSRYIRVAITARTDGTYSAYLDALV